MRVVIQRSKQSSVTVDNQIVGQIEKGMVLLVCFEKGDTENNMEKAIQKIWNIRMFEDPVNGKMSLNLNQTGGEILCISQFTLSWDGEKGNRPSFDNSMDPHTAKEFYHLFCQKLEKLGMRVAKGIFGAYMDVHIKNDGPVTFFLKF